jgi:hypothetical protein
VPVVAPAAAPAPKAQPASFNDPVVVAVNAAGIPLNAAKAFVSQKVAIRPD